MLESTFLRLLKNLNCTHRDGSSWIKALGRGILESNSMLARARAFPGLSESGTLGEILRRAIYGNAAYRPEIESC
jgi:hypothetical protein